MRPIVMAVAALAALAMSHGALAQQAAPWPAGDGPAWLAQRAPASPGPAGGVDWVGAVTGGPAGIAAPVPAPGGAGAVVIAFEFEKTCRAEDAAVIRSAFERAAAGLQRGIAHMQREPGSAHYVEWFGTAPPKEVLRVYTAIVERMRSTEPVRVNCWSGGMCGGGVFAYTSTGAGTPVMGFCETFFNAADDGFDSRPGTVVHEMSHLAAGTSDIAYGVAGARRLAGAKEGVDAARNADNFEYFIEALPADR